MTPYQGHVATQITALSQSFFASFKQANSRAHCFARDSFSNPVLTFPAFYCNGTSEVAFGANVTITASIEYPAGVFTQITFSGSATGTITDGSYITSDACPVSIPNGASFWVRSFVNCTAGIAWSNYTDTNNGEAGNLAASGLSDQTLGGTIPNDHGPYRPVSIVATTRKPSVLMLGDSRCGGFTDTVTDASGDRGEIARSIGPVLAYINMGVNSDRAVTFVTSHTNRLAIGLCCSHVIGQYGINDLINVNNYTAAQFEANMATVAGYFPNRPFFPCTVAPDTTSTDSWSTAANQTIKTNEAARQTYNTSIRTLGPSWRRWGCLDIASIMEDQANIGKWVSAGGAVTGDGLHENTLGNATLKSSGVISPYRVGNAR
ncbi:MAG: SGNH/GDSL hydrolase family protein [Nitrobacter sp.]